LPYPELIRRRPALHALYLQAIGESLGWGLLYDQLIDSHLSVRIGLGTTFYGITLPGGVSYLMGVNKQFEVGAGLTYLTNSDERYSGTTDKFFPYIILGYRRQPIEGGTIYRIGFEPIYAITQHFIIP